MPLDPATFATMNDEELARTLRVDAGTLVDVARTFAQNPSSTIEPPPQNRTDTPGRRALEGLGGGHGTIVHGLALEKTIGEGGMGIVRLATQRALGRKVAVKTLRPESRSEAATLRLLREAWVTGSLEHPNIVPVYDLGLDEDGSPVIVLKKIEGVEWASLLRDPSALRALAGEQDHLEHGLRVLVQLCNAVSLAHARGIVHRDLKPENVMIGSFGEVYLVDWGIAVSVREDPTGRFPSAADAKEIAGTPAYMAPEMLGAVGAISERTDVYLLGAILHEILTGKPPHQGNFRQIVGSVLMSEPSYAADVPRELASIARRAMSRLAEARFASADELRERLEWYLRHRGSLALSKEAEKSLAEIRDIVVARRSVVPSSDESDDDVRDRVYHLFAEARFGFRQALAASLDNTDARRGLREAIETVVGFELDSGTAHGASTALVELDDPPPSLVKRVAEASAAAKEKLARLEQMRAQLDPSTGRKTRLAVGLMAGSVWTIAPLLGPVLERNVDIHAPHAMRVMYFWTAFLALVGFALGYWGRESLAKTVVNRRMRSAVVVNFAGQLMLELGCDLLGVPWAQAIVLHFVIWFLATAYLSTLIEPRLKSAAIGYAVFFVAACIAPEWRWQWIAAAQLVLVITTAYAWGSLQDTRSGRHIAERVRQRTRQR